MPRQFVGGRRHSTNADGGVYCIVQRAEVFLQERGYAAMGRAFSPFDAARAAIYGVAIG